jgi:hypothetical protein
MLCVLLRLSRNRLNQWQFPSLLAASKQKFKYECTNDTSTLVVVPQRTDWQLNEGCGRHVHAKIIMVSTLYMTNDSTARYSLSICLQ